MNEMLVSDWLTRVVGSAGPASGCATYFRSFTLRAFSMHERRNPTATHEEFIKFCRLILIISSATEPHNKNTFI